MKSLRIGLLGLTLGAFGLLSAGCTVSTAGLVTVDALWTIGLATPTYDDCAAAGIDQVELVVYDDPSGAFVREVYTSYCEDGGFIATDTLPYGYYYYQWTGYDRAGNPIQESAITDLDVRYDDVAYLDVDFDPPHTNVRIDVFWDNGAGGYGTCASSVVNDGMDYYLTLPSSGTDVVVQENVPCADTIYVDYEDDGWALTELSYGVFVAGYATDATYWEVDCGNLPIDLGVTNVIECYADIVP